MNGQQQIRTAGHQHKRGADKKPLQQQKGKPVNVLWH